MATTHWLKCKVSPGMFSSERLVEFKDFNLEGFSLFVPKEEVHGDGYVRVELRKVKDGLCLIKLPTKIIGGHEYVTVTEDQLERRDV